MNTAAFVDQQIAAWKAEGKDLQWTAWNTALLCVGWPYVFGARGEYCTPANRRRYYRDAHQTIKTKCKNFEGTGSCSGCKWFPNGQRVRFFDCRGFTYWVLLTVYGWKLMGTGATSQWNNADNWKAKGTVADGLPADTLVCLFVKKGKTMEHTGFGFNNETVECSSGVQHFTTRNKKWTDWGVPACIDGTIPDPSEDQGIGEPAYIDKRPLLQRGSKNKYVKLLQETLISLGYNLGICGADGDFGTMTLDAVLRFQREHGLKADGIVGPETYAALDKAAAGKQTEIPSEKTYSVIIRGLDYTQASAVANNYPGAEIVEGSVAK